MIHLKRASQKIKSSILNISLFIKWLVYFFIFRFLPINKNVAVFESFWGRSYDCNPLALSDYLSKNSELKIVWSVNKGTLSDLNASEDVIFVHRMSWRYFYYLGVSKFFISNVNYPSFLLKRKNSIHIQTQHGTPLKLMGEDIKDTEVSNLRKRSERWDYVISSNAYSTKIWKKCFPYPYTIVESGYPRNDILVRHRDDHTLKEEILRRHAMTYIANRTVILYMPTWREYEFDYSRYISELINNTPDDIVILYKKHQLDSSTDPLMSSKLILADQGFKVNELYLISDLLVTDYSSAMFDYANLQRPIVLFMPDYSRYVESRGVYFDVTISPPGEVTFSVKQLSDSIMNKTYQSAAASEKLTHFHEIFCEYDRGDACMRIYKDLFSVH